LSEKDKKIAAEKFLEWYDRLPWKPAGLEVKQYDRMNATKIDNRLYPLLDKISQRWINQDWYYIPTPIARGYMFYVSKTAADRRNISRATDDRDSWTVSSYFAEKGNFRENVYDPEARAYYSALLIRDLIPANISNVPIEEIINFLEDRNDLKAEFRDEIVEFSKELSQCDNEDYVDELISTYGEEIKNKKRELKKSAGFWNSANRSFLFSIGIPISSLVLKAHANPVDPFQMQDLIVGTLSVVAAYSNYRDLKKKTRGNSYYSYLIDMDQRLVGTKNYPNYSHIFKEFIND
jgi:hypothetical protein